MSKIRKRKCSSNEGVNNVYTVETIYKKKIRNNKEPLYFIKWKDWDDKYNTWEPLSNILDQSLIETFEDEIRQKQKLRKDTSKVKKLDWDKVDYESDVKSDSQDETNTVDEVQLMEDDKQEEDEKIKCEQPVEEVITRPKICIKIPKSKLHPPLTNPIVTDLISPEMEIPRHIANHSDSEHNYMCKLSPNYLSEDLDLTKSIRDESPSRIKSHKKHEFQKNLQKLKCKLETKISKPRKLLSINEYSAAIKMKKKHHKKSKHSKHRSENTKIFKSLMDIKNTISYIEKSVALTPPKEKPISVDENKVHQWPKSRLGESVLKEMERKLESSKFKFHFQTVVTDVTVNGLCVTVKEMSYEDFINDGCRRVQMVRVPRNSDWDKRFFGEKNSEDMGEEVSEDEEEARCFGEEDVEYGVCMDEEEDRRCPNEEDEDVRFLGNGKGSQSDEEEDVMIVEKKCSEHPLTKQRLLDRFEERIIPGLRPPSRPRSVDSYRNMYGIARHAFTDSLTPGRVTVDPTDTDVDHVCSKSPLNIVIDECEEVDVVGGIESEHSFMSSVQSTRTTMTAQLCQARLETQSPVSSIIQSLWHSYSYNPSLGMPPLQAAPWVEPHEVSVMHPHNQYLSRSSSIDSTVLKFTHSMPLHYYQHQQQSNNNNSLLSSLFHSNGTIEETPIDLSFK